MTDSLRGMVLAAGYGTRLAPVTDHVPKPLLAVGGITLLARAVGTLATAGCAAVAVNTHHLGPMIAEHLATLDFSVPCRLFPEDEILGTGGALFGAREFLAGADNFLLHNGDVLWPGEAGILVRQHQQSGALATLLLTDWPAVNTVAVDEAGAVLSLHVGHTKSARQLTYTGIGVFSRRILKDIGPGFSSLIDPLTRAVVDCPGSVRGVVQEGTQWSDLGTLGRYLRALGSESASEGPLRVERLVGHGSERRFWRLSTDNWSAVAMLDVPGSEEFSRQVAVSNILVDKGLGAASLLAVDVVESALLMEDLGPDDLWSQVATSALDSAGWLRIYEPVVDRLLCLQKNGSEILAAEPLTGDRLLGSKDLRWETDYFQEQFLQGYLGLDPAALAGLTTEFAALAQSVAAQPLVLIHRDFQSRNIMLPSGGIGLVDVQGMRRGPLLYDLASLLWDPYVALPEEAREVLLERFTVGLAGEGLTPPVIRAMFLAAALQRLMQALGAFAFLGLRKGKTDFLQHIRRALANLQQVLVSLPLAAEAAQDFLPGPLPRLTTLVDSIVAKQDHEVTDD